MESLDPENRDLSDVHLGSLLSTSWKGPNALESSNYYAVSHVWGKVEKYEVAGIPWMVPISSEKKLLSILHACVCRGYEHVWMDVLCVNQESTADSLAEITKMKDYYKNAGATIIFGEKYLDFAGLWKKVEELIREWEENWDKQISADWHGFPDIQDFLTDSWFHRVWTLQEAVIPLMDAPASYTPNRLLTSDGAAVDIRRLCGLIEWTYLALGKLDLGTSPYPWIHPGAGVVNDHSWEKVAKIIHAIRPGPSPLHPIQALMLTQHRDTSREIDKLRGFYALIDSDWHSLKEDFNDACTEIAEKYVQQREGALLLAMAVTPSINRTWAAAAFRNPNHSLLGSFVPDSGCYPLISATIVNTTALRLTVAGYSKITTVEDRNYGDGSGELEQLIRRLKELSPNHNISSIIALLSSVIDRSRINLNGTQLHDISSIGEAVRTRANAVSSILRSTFSGWNRRIIIVNETAFLAWLPTHLTHECDLGRSCFFKMKPHPPPLSSTPRCGTTYSLLWLTSEKDEWAVIVENPLKRCRKVGIAYVKGSKPVAPQTVVTIL
ncbi:heterokaryon incompatibility protein-domain-containing protein [Mycena metata]|uniref:Heterokaryon incompatibility protein-domain-containing protein n=1 Tax=Mycena metata TaxID=1033252 RepID=A0AAD7IHK2_9AGAR|nr:heterokaryon incompatibility protein-domain-containing protein [Mycena metata]